MVLSCPTSSVKTRLYITLVNVDLEIPVTVVRVPVVPSCLLPNGVTSLVGSDGGGKDWEEKTQTGGSGVGGDLKVNGSLRIDLTFHLYRYITWLSERRVIG